MERYHKLLKEDFGKACVYIHKNSKGSLFRYRSFDSKGHNISALKENRIYLSAPSNVNDPWNCRTYLEYKPNPDSFFKTDISDDEMLKESSLEVGVDFDLINILSSDQNKQIIENYSSNSQEIENKNIYYEKEYNDKRKELITEKFRLGCFSEDCESILMWSHYAYYHKGFCLEYDIDELKKYTNIMPVIYLKEPFDFWDEYVERQAQNSIIANYFKYDAWKYEEEWRIVVMKNDCKENENNISYIDMPNPKHIYLGVNASKENEQILQEIAKEKGFDISRMKMRNNKYELYT